MEINFRTVPPNLFITLVENKLISLGFPNYPSKCTNTNKCAECKKSSICLLYLSVIEEINRAYAEEVHNENYDFKDWFNNTIEIFKMGIVVEPSRIKVNIVKSSQQESNPKEFTI